MKKSKIYLDASALVAYFNCEDEFYPSASAIVDTDEIALDLYTCDVTLLEVQYVLWRKVDRIAAIDVVQGLIESEDVTVLVSDMEDVATELEIFKLHAMPSFDALICAVMDREDIGFLLSFDRNHFDSVDGVTRIEHLDDLKAMLR